MLFRRFKLLSFLGILVLVAAVTSGLSYWAFTDSSSADSTNQSVSGGGENHPTKSDGIFENYSFSNGELGDKYEFYFFPSTLYLELYSNVDTPPEDVFGYNEVQLDDNGNAIINDNGLAKYEVIGDEEDEKEHRTGLDRYSLQTGKKISVSTYYEFLTNVDVINNDSYYLNKDAQISKDKGYQLFEDYDKRNNDFESYQGLINHYQHPHLKLDHNNK